MALLQAPAVPCLPPCSFQIGPSSNKSMGAGCHHMYVCRSAFYGVREDVTLETGDSKPTRFSLSFPTRAKTWPKVWCTSHGRRAGHDGARHALFAALRFGRALHFGSRARTCRLLERAILTQWYGLNLDH